MATNPFETICSHELLLAYCPNHLREQLRQANAEIERLRAELNTTIDNATEREMQLAHECDRAREVAVWAVRKGVMVGHDECVRPCIWFDVHRGVEHDGTDASIYAALEGAMRREGRSND